MKLVGFYKDGIGDIKNAGSIVAIYDIDDKYQLSIKLTHEGLIADLINDEEDGEIEDSCAYTADEFVEFMESLPQ
jgi:hypothetical protein